MHIAPYSSNVFIAVKKFHHKDNMCNKWLNWNDKPFNILLKMFQRQEKLYM